MNQTRVNQGGSVVSFVVVGVVLVGLIIGGLYLLKGRSDDTNKSPSVAVSGSVNKPGATTTSPSPTQSSAPAKSTTPSPTPSTSAAPSQPPAANQKSLSPSPSPSVNNTTAPVIPTTGAGDMMPAGFILAALAAGIMYAYQAVRDRRSHAHQ